MPFPEFPLLFSPIVMIRGSGISLHQGSSWSNLPIKKLSSIKVLSHCCMPLLPFPLLVPFGRIYGILICPPKLKHFWRKACVNALASKYNHWKRNCSLDPLWPRCIREIETVEHVIFRYSFVLKVWKSFPEATSVISSNIVSVVQWSNEWIDSKRFLISLAVCGGWFLWKACNLLVF